MYLSFSIHQIISISIFIFFYLTILRHSLCPLKSPPSSPPPAVVSFARQLTTSTTHYIPYIVSIAIRIPFSYQFSFSKYKKRRFPIKKNLYFDGFLRLYHKHIFALYFVQKKRKRNKNKNIECIGAVTG